jgi:hypothetical protein
LSTRSETLGSGPFGAKHAPAAISARRTRSTEPLRTLAPDSIRAMVLRPTKAASASLDALQPSPARAMRISTRSFSVVTDCIMTHFASVCGHWLVAILLTRACPMARRRRFCDAFCLDLESGRQ